VKKLKVTKIRREHSRRNLRLQVAMDFGDAIRELKLGNLVRRHGWNGKGMYLYLWEFASHLEHGVRRYEDCIVMVTAQKKHQPGWLASQADMLAEDWFTVDPMKRAKRATMKRPKITNYAGGSRR